MAEGQVIRFSPLGTRLAVFGFIVWSPVLGCLMLGEVLPGVVSGVVAAVASVVVLFLCLRSALILTDEFLVIQNPFRTTRLRWEAVLSIEPSRGRDRPSDQLQAVTTEGRHRIAVTFGAGRRGAELVDAFKNGPRRPPSPAGPGLPAAPETGMVEPDKDELATSPVGAGTARSDEPGTPGCGGLG